MQRMLELVVWVLVALDLEQTWRNFYRKAFDGVKDFLDDIRLLGIPIAIEVI